MTEPFIGTIVHETVRYRLTQRQLIAWTSAGADHNSIAALLIVDDPPDPSLPPLSIAPVISPSTTPTPSAPPTGSDVKAFLTLGQDDNYEQFAIDLGMVPDDVYVPEDFTVINNIPEYTRVSEGNQALLKQHVQKFVFMKHINNLFVGQDTNIIVEKMAYFMIVRGASVTNDFWDLDDGIVIDPIQIFIQGFNANVIFRAYGQAAIRKLEDEDKRSWLQNYAETTEPIIVPGMEYFENSTKTLALYLQATIAHRNNQRNTLAGSAVVNILKKISSVLYARNISVEKVLNHFSKLKHWDLIESGGRKAQSEFARQLIIHNSKGALPDKYKDLF
jgi:SOS-response transcriptional repressor LexA